MADVYKETGKQLKQMEEELKGVVDINYARYNNKYMDIAGDHMMAMKADKEKQADYQQQDVAEEAADRLFNKLTGRIIL